MQVHPVAGPIVAPLRTRRQRQKLPQGELQAAVLNAIRSKVARTQAGHRFSLPYRPPRRLDLANAAFACALTHMRKAARITFAVIPIPDRRGTTSLPAPALQRPARLLLARATRWRMRSKRRANSYIPSVEMNLAIRAHASIC